MAQIEMLTQKCDAVVMLTASNWFTEPVSNRYHYATRFARYLPVLFVQNDLESDAGYFEPSGHDNITILHVPVEYGAVQRAAIKKALCLKKVRRPLYWLYNVDFGYFLENRPAALKVFHATEDFLKYSYADKLLPGIETTLKNIDLLVGAGPFISDSYGTLGITGYKDLFLPNGCDYDYWALSEAEIQALEKDSPQKLAIYQGGINDRVDFDLLDALAGAMPEWRFVLCGKGSLYSQVKQRFARHPNVEMPGQLPLDAVRTLCLQASVGLIPYLDNELVGILLPLKAYEYLAVGLPVVYQRRMASLGGKPAYFHPASTLQEYRQTMLDIWQTRNTGQDIRRRMALAKTADYGQRFGQLLKTVIPMLRDVDMAACGNGGLDGVRVFGGPSRGRRYERRFIKRRDDRERGSQKRKRRMEKLYGFIERHPRLKAFYEKRLKAGILARWVVGDTFLDGTPNESE